MKNINEFVTSYTKDKVAVITARFVGSISVLESELESEDAVMLAVCNYRFIDIPLHKCSLFHFKNVFAS